MFVLTAILASTLSAGINAMSFERWDGMRIVCPPQSKTVLKLVYTGISRPEDCLSDCVVNPDCGVVTARHISQSNNDNNNDGGGGGAGGAGFRRFQKLNSKSIGQVHLFYLLGKPHKRRKLAATWISAM